MSSGAEFDGVRYRSPLRAAVVASCFCLCSLGGCGGGGGGIPNVLPIQVRQGPGGTLAGGTVAGLAFNEPYTEVTVCAVSPARNPFTAASCLTIDNIIVDTGSTGLRIFKQALTPAILGPFPPAAAGEGPPQLAECYPFAIGNSWGPVVQAAVTLGGEPPVEVPVQIIDSSFQTQSIPSWCNALMDSPSDSDYNGILGIGPGPAPNDMGSYLACWWGGACSQIIPSPTLQVTNPVSALPSDSNGVIVSLPPISPNGVASVSGIVILGIDTENDNNPSIIESNPVYVFPAVLGDPGGASFETVTADSLPFNWLIPDTGSNGIFFDDASIPQGLNRWFCPSSVRNLTASVSAPNARTWTFNFSIMCPSFSTNFAFDNVGAPINPEQNLFDFGLPLFFGRDVYFVYNNAPSSLGTGPLYGFADQ